VSRYEIDKLMRHIEESDGAVQAYAADPAAYVAEWERRAAEARTPPPDGGVLTDEERAAFVSKDPIELYRLGAHPYLLWHFAEAVFVWAGDTKWPDANRLFRDGVAQHGYPDFGT